jgi:thiol-disulfide isomerase/thioredoxin
VDEVKAIMQGSADVESKFPVDFDGKDPVQPVKDLSTFQTPGQLWVYILKLRSRPAGSEEAAAANNGSIQLAGADFLKRWPKDPLRWDVKLGNDEAAIQLGMQAKGGFDAAKTEADLRQIAAAADAAQETKDSAAFDIAMIEVGKADDAKIEPLVAALHRDHPAAFDDDTLTTLLKPRLDKYDDDKKAALLTPLAQSADPGIADQAGALLRFATAKKKLEALKTAPLDLKFTALDGTQVDIAKLRGKVVLVDFWATWCGPCMEEAPNVVAAYKKYRDKGFEVIGISLDQKKEDVQRVTREQGMEWPQYFDGKYWNNEISSSYGIESIPAMWLVDKKGMVVNQNAGDALEDNIEKLLAE